jgi:hypothetical protein
MKNLVAVFALGFFAMPAAAQLAAPAHIVPVIAKTGGVAGTDWMTTISMSNVSDATIDVTALFLRENTTNIPPFVPTETFALDGGRTMTVEDVLRTWYPAQGDTKGALVLLAELRGAGEGEYAQLTAATRIFNNADPAATYGQGVVSSLLGLMVAPGRLVLTGARFDDAVRSNVGVVNISASNTYFIITAYHADGAEVATVRQRVRAFSMSQWSLQQLGVAAMTIPGRVEIMIDPATVTWDPCDQDPENLDLEGAAFLAYMSRVDQATSDAEFSPGQSDWKAYTDLCGENPDLSLRAPPALTDEIEWSRSILSLAEKW